MSSPNSPLLLAELVIPGRSKKPVSTDPDVWGINIAAALGNFPLHGMKCQAGPWGNMAFGDKLTILWGTGQIVWVETVDQDEVGTQLSMFVPPRHMVDGQFAASYVVKLLGGTDQPSEVMQVRVKLTRPGGHDDNGDGGHSKLVMIIPQDILEGIHAGNVAAGAPITIGNNDGTPPYPFAAAGDVCRVSWGGVYVYSDPLTEEQAQGKTLIIVKVEEADIREAGDADAPGVAVVFEVYDCVFNRSEDWSPEQRVPVAVDTTRADAPLLKETVNNVLDVDKLGDADGTVQIIAMDTSKFKIGDLVFIRIKGTPVEGPPIDWEPSAGVKLESVPSIMEIMAPNAVLRQLAKSQITLSYRLEKADGSAELRSKSQFIRAIGEVKRLAAPILPDENSGSLDPTLDRVELKIPFDKSFAEGQVLTIVMLGTTPGLKPYLPDLPTRPITHNDIVAAEPLLYSIDGAHLNPVNGGTAEFYYQLQIPDTVLDTLNPFEATRAVRESIHTDILRVGKPRLELPQPQVAGVVDGVLPADTAGTTLTVIYTETVTGDEVFMFWIGSITGEYRDSIKLNELTAGKEVPFPIDAKWIKGNEGGTVIAKYQIKRAAGGTSYAEPLEFSVGVALENPLPLPQMPQATGTGASVTLAPLDAQTGARVVVAYTGMNEKHSIKLTVLGTPGAGSPDIPAKPGVNNGSVEFLIPAEAVAANIGKNVKNLTLQYEVTSPGSNEVPSKTLTVTVMPLPAAELDKLSIVQADDGELDLSKITAGGTIKAGVWAFIAPNQRVKLVLKGRKNNGDEFNQVIWPWPSSYVNQNWITAGEFTYPLAYDDVKDLAHDSQFEMHFKAALTLSQVEADAIDGPVKRYRVKAVEDVAPMIDLIVATDNGEEIAEGATIVKTAVTLSGIGAKGQKVEAFDNGKSIDTPLVDGAGEWTLPVSGLALTLHKFTVARIGSGDRSEERTLTVTELVTPTLTSVKDSKDVEVPEGAYTVSTSLTVSGKASKGQEVEIFDGTAPDAESKGKALADSVTGDWRRPISIDLGPRRLFARSLYHNGEMDSGARSFTATAEVSPTIDSVKGLPSNVEIENGGTTEDREVILTGAASKGLNVEIFDGANTSGSAAVNPTTGTWKGTVNNLNLGDHIFTVKASYGAEQISQPRNLQVMPKLDDLTTFTNYEWNGWSNANPQHPISITATAGEYFVISQPGTDGYHRTLEIVKAFPSLDEDKTYTLSFDYKCASNPWLSTTGIPGISLPASAQWRGHSSTFIMPSAFPDYPPPMYYFSLSGFSNNQSVSLDNLRLTKN